MYCLFGRHRETFVVQHEAYSVTRHVIWRVTKSNLMQASWLCYSRNLLYVLQLPCMAYMLSIQQNFWRSIELVVAVLTTTRDTDAITPSNTHT